MRNIFVASRHILSWSIKLVFSHLMYLHHSLIKNGHYEFYLLS